MSKRAIVEIAEATTYTLGYVIEHMRPIDKREVYALRPNDDKLGLAMDLYGRSPLCFTAFERSGKKGRIRPVACYGAAPMWPGVWQVWMIATSRWRAVSREVTDAIRTELIPVLVKEGAHRVECCALAENKRTIAWLESLGARIEGVPLECFGRNRETFVRLVGFRTPEILALADAIEDEPAADQEKGEDDDDILPNAG